MAGMLPKVKHWPEEAESIMANSETLREAMGRVDSQEQAEAQRPTVEALRAVEAAVAADPKVSRGRRRADAIDAVARARIDSGRSVHVTSPDDVDAAYEIADILHRRAEETP